MPENKKGERLVNFKIDSDLYERIFFLARELYGHGGIKKLYNDLSNNFAEKYDGKTSKLDSFIDPNFTPKPTVFDDTEKVVTPFAMQLSDEDLHKLRMWAFQTHTICTAYSKLTANRRKVTKMNYEECLKVLRKAENVI